MDLMAYNLAVLLPDLYLHTLTSWSVQKRYRRLAFMLMFAYDALMRLVNGLTDWSIEWTLAVFFAVVMMRFGEGTPGRRAIRTLLVFTLANLTAPVGYMLVPIMGMENTPTAYRHEILQHPEYFALQVASFVMCSVLLVPCRVLIRVFDNKSLGHADRLTLLYTAIPAVVLLVCVRSAAYAQRISVLSFTLSAVATAVHLIASVLLQRDTLAAIDASRARAILQSEEQSSASYVRHFKSLEKKIQSTAMLRHDLRNQLGVAERLANEGGLAAAQQMVNTVEGRLHDVSALGDLAEVELGAGTQEQIERASAGSRSRIWTIAYSIDLLATLALFLHTVIIFEVSTPIVVVCAIVLLVWLLLMPTLGERIREAQRLDIDLAKAKAAQDTLQARVFYAKRLESEAERADAMAERLRAEVALVRKRIDGQSKTVAVGLAPIPEGYVPYCENRLLDALLALKAAECQDRGIAFCCAADVPDGLGIEGLELCALFSNALDNAIAACEGLAEGERWVNVNASVKAGYLVALIRNSCKEGAVALPSAQPTLESHGWGLRILAQLANRYGGDVKAGEKDGIFTVRLSVRA